MIVFPFTDGAEPVECPIFRLPPPHVFCSRKQIFTENLIWVVRVNLTNAKFIRSNKDFSIRDFLCHPQPRHIFWSWHHFNDPGFLGISNRQCFSSSVITILIYQFTDQQNCVFCQLATFQCYTSQLGTVKQTIRARHGIICF